jgi:hypothetical protein
MNNLFLNGVKSAGRESSKHQVELIPGGCTEYNEGKGGRWMMERNRVTRLALVAATIFLGFALTAPIHGQAKEPTNQAHLVVTVKVKGSRPVPVLDRNDIAVKVKNHPTNIVDWVPLTDSKAGLQLVFLIDESAHSSLSQQIPSLKKFIESLPTSAAVGIAYMGNGRAIMAGPMTTDHTQAANDLRLTTGMPGISGSPYFCLSDLAKHWPSNGTSVRRVVLMVTNGEDPYHESRSMQDPYVDNAIQDSQKAGLLVYSIYFSNHGFGNPNNVRAMVGQNYLLQVAAATGAEAYLVAFSNQVSFDPFLKQLRWALNHQYLLTVATSGSGLQQVSVKSNVPDVKLVAPKAVYAGETEERLVKTRGSQ